MNQPFDLCAYRARRSRPGHWSDQHQADELPPCDMPIPPEPAPLQRPAWPLLACFGFPFLLALVVWLVLTSLKG